MVYSNLLVRLGVLIIIALVLYIAWRKYEKRQKLVITSICALLMLVEITIGPILCFRVLPCGIIMLISATTKIPGLVCYFILWTRTKNEQQE
nr:hypothetical transcript [Hymenolepis microstoma]